MDIYSKIYTILISTFLGAGLGFLAKSYFVRLGFRQSTIESIVNRYLDARDELCALVAECAVKTDSQDEQWLNETRKSISLAYYKYYDYMPNEVIKELICLQACLKDSNNRLYKIHAEKLRRIEKNDLQIFCETIATFKNIAPAIYFNLHNGAESDMRDHRIEYQARHTLININRYFTEKNLTSLNLFRPKAHNN